MLFTKIGHLSGQLFVHTFKTWSLTVLNSFVQKENTPMLLSLDNKQIPVYKINKALNSSVKWHIQKKKTPKLPTLLAILFKNSSPLSSCQQILIWIRKAENSRLTDDDLAELEENIKTKLNNDLELKMRKDYKLVY